MTAPLISKKATALLAPFVETAAGSHKGKPKLQQPLYRKPEFYLFMPGQHQLPGLRFPSAHGSVRQCPAGRPGYRSRPRAHAVSTSLPLPGGRGIRRCSGTRPGCRCIGGREIRPAACEKTFQRPGDLLQDQLHAGNRIVFQFRIAPLGSDHHRMRSRRQQNLDMVQA